MSFVQYLPLRLVLAFVGLAALVACSNGSQETDQVFAQLDRQTCGYQQRVGYHVGEICLTLRNVTKDPVTLDRIIIDGPGIGTIARIDDVKAYPFTDEEHSLPYGGSTLNPPRTLINGRCVVGILRPLEGFQLAPGDDVRVWVWIKALKPGSFHVANHKVEFEQNGKEFFQILPVGYQGRVTANPAFPVHTRGELACIHAHA